MNGDIEWTKKDLKPIVGCPDHCERNDHKLRKALKEINESSMIFAIKFVAYSYLGNQLNAIESMECLIRQLNKDFPEWEKEIRNKILKDSKLELKENGKN